MEEGAAGSKYILQHLPVPGASMSAAGGGAGSGGGSSRRPKRANTVKADVEAQSELMRRAGSVWNLVTSGDEDASLEVLKQRLASGQEDVFARGPVGENILHLAFLTKRFKIAEYLVKTYGRPLVNAPYQLRRSRHDTERASLYEGGRARCVDQRSRHPARPGAPSTHHRRHHHHCCRRGRQLPPVRNLHHGCRPHGLI